MEYTPEEIAAMHDRNENFCGTRANLEKIALYQAVKSDLVKFMEQCDEVYRVEGFDPNEREKHAVVWMDLVSTAILTKDETAKLAEIMNRVDGTVLSAVDGHIRISFDINDIWEE